jgi:hypothetical protein
MATDAQGRQLSEDGHYYWDGFNWQLLDAAAGEGSQQSAVGSQDAQGRQLSEDGNYHWDGSNWQPVDAGSVAGPGQAVGSASSSSSDPLDGGLLPGGTAPERGQCDTDGCPTCASELSMSSPCIHQIYHQGDHECANGHSWSAGSQAICGANCPQNDGTCQLDDLHKSAGIPHEHGGGGVSHRW